MRATGKRDSKHASYKQKHHAHNEQPSVVPRGPRHPGAPHANLETTTQVSPTAEVTTHKHQTLMHCLCSCLCLLLLSLSLLHAPPRCTVALLAPIAPRLRSALCSAHTRSASGTAQAHQSVHCTCLLALQVGMRIVHAACAIIHVLVQAGHSHFAPWTAVRKHRLTHHKLVMRGTKAHSRTAGLRK